MAKEKEKSTHIMVYDKERERLIEIRDRLGYASIAIVLRKLLDKCGGGLK